MPKPQPNPNPSHSTHQQLSEVSMTKFIDTLNNIVKLISSLATIAMLGGMAFGGLWVYHKVAELTSKPIQMPAVMLPEVKLPEHITLPTIKMPEKITMPEIKIPEIKMPEIK